MQSIVYEILAEDHQPQLSPPTKPPSSWLGWLRHRIPGIKPRLLVVSPAMMGVDSNALAPDLYAELLERGFVVLRVARYRKAVGFVVHRMNLAFRSPVITLRERAVTAGSAVPLAFYLPLPAAGWAIYETSQTLTLRYTSCGFLTWSVGSETELQSMHCALEKLNLARPKQIYHAGSTSIYSRQIAQRISRPLVFGELSKSPDLHLELFRDRGLAGFARDGIDATDLAWHGIINRARQFLSSWLGISALGLVLTASISFAVQTLKQQALPVPAAGRIDQALQESGSAYWRFSNLISGEIRRSGITQIQSLRILIETNKGSSQSVVSMTWSTLKNLTLRSVDEKSQLLIQAQLIETLKKHKDVALAEVDLANHRIFVKLQPVELSDGLRGPNVEKWIGEMKKAYAVQLETKSATITSVRLRAPDQPVGNLLAFLSSASLHPSLKEISIYSASLGLASAEIELELSP